MTVNRFNTPVKDNYISQYVPIPFEQLFQLGKAYNEEVDKAYDQLGSQLQKWSDFKSPSSVDTRRWYDLTINPAKNLVNEMSANPDMMKTAEGRSRIQSFINSRPYQQLSMLKQSKDQMLARQAAEQKLSLAGKYNPLWHGFDYSGYDTLNPKNGVFQDVNLTPYMSEVDLVKPYVDNLQDEFIPEMSNGLYDYKGVTEKRTDNAVRQNLSAIYNTPEAQMHIKALTKQGYTPEQAQALFADRIYRAGREFSRVNRELNAAGRQFAAYGNRSGSDEQGGNPFTLTQGMQHTGLRTYFEGRERYLMQNPEYMKAKELLVSGTPEEKEAAQNKIKALSDSASMPNMFGQIIRNKKQSQFEAARTSPTLTLDKSGIQGQHLKEQVDAVFNTFGWNTGNARVNDELQQAIPGVTLEPTDTPFGKRRKITNGQNLNLMSDIVMKVGHEIPGVQKQIDKFQNALHANKLNDMIVLNNGNIISIPVTSGNSTYAEHYQQVKVAISEEDMRNANLTTDDMKALGATRRAFDGKSSTSKTVSGEVTIDSDTDAEIHNPEKWSSTSSTQKGKKYWVVDLATNLPRPGSGIGAEALDQAWMKDNVSSSAYTQQYTNNQQNAFFGE